MFESKRGVQISSQVQSKNILFLLSRYYERISSNLLNRNVSRGQKPFWEQKQCVDVEFIYDCIYRNENGCLIGNDGQMESENPRFAPTVCLPGLSVLIMTRSFPFKGKKHLVNLFFNRVKSIPLNSEQRSNMFRYTKY